MSKGQLPPLLLDAAAQRSTPAFAGNGFLWLTAAALLLRLVLAPWLAHSGDMGTFTGWGLRLAEVGPGSFWNDSYWCDYLPGYLYVLWAIGEVASLLPAPLHVLLFKLPNLVADVATAYLIWKVLRPTDEDRKLWAPTLYLFNPAVLFNSTLWGQADSFHTLFLVGALTLLGDRRPLWSAVVLGCAAATKPHTVVLLPLVGLYALTTRVALNRIALCVVVVAGIFGLSFLPFNNWAISTLPAFIGERVGVTMGQYGHASVNAMNFWYLLGKNWVSDDAIFVGSVTIRQVGTALCGAGYVFALGWYAARARRGGRAALWEAAAMIFLITFLFVTRAHERHLFPYFAMMAVVVGLRRGAVLPYGLLSFTYCLNIVLAWLYLLPQHRSAALCDPVPGALICGANLLALPLTVVSFTKTGDRWWAWVVERLSMRQDPEFDAEPAAVWTPKHGRLILAGILLFALGLRVVRLNTPNERYFDEVYHAYTAERWVQGDTDAWLWSTKAPDKGCAYEWTHPPLAKLVMAWSMRLFGVHPWAWRLPAALLGTLCVLLIYLIARALFQAPLVGLLAAAFAALDGLPLVLSRIGMNDVYCLTFILIAVWAALRGRIAVSPFAVGAALACKWTALYTFPLLGLIHLFRSPAAERWRLRRLTGIVALYAVVVPAMYVGSYLPFFQAGHNWGQFVEVQRQMWYYHTRLDKTHAFSSKAWRWPFAGGTVWCYTGEIDGGKDAAASPANATGTGHSEDMGSNSVDAATDSADAATDSAGVTRANIYAAGNPIIWLAGLGSIVFTGMHIIQRRDPRLGIVAMGYLMFWAPWLASPRIMFLYHYLPALPFLYIALAWSMVHTQVRRAHIVLFLILAAVVLAIMYPYLTAVPMPESLTPGRIGAYFTR